MAPNEIPLPIRSLDPKAILPTRWSVNAAAYDLAAYEPYIAPPNVTTVINLGFALAIPPGYCGLILPRSGLATHERLRPVNTPGLIDPDYRGEIKVALENFGHKPRNINGGTRVAQLLIVPFYQAAWQEMETLPETSRGSNGFGSTGGLTDD